MLNKNQIVKLIKNQEFKEAEIACKNYIENNHNDGEIYYNLDSKKYILSYKNRTDKNLKKLPMPKEPLIKYLKNYHKNRKELLCAFIETYKCLESK